MLVEPSALVDAEGVRRIYGQLRAWNLPVHPPELPPKLTGEELRAILVRDLDLPDVVFPSLLSESYDEAVPVASVRTETTPTVAGSMIVKDGLSRGADVIRALRSIAPVCSEIRVVDTGSTDGTQDKIAELSAAGVFPCPVHVTDRPWRDDFSAARNECLDWVPESIDVVMWTDDDEEYSILAAREIRAALEFDATSIARGDVIGYSMELIGYGIPNGQIWRTRV